MLFITVSGRTQKPLLRARPVRDNPKSTPRLNPPLHSESFFRLVAFGSNSSTDDNAPILGPKLRVLFR